MSNDNTHGDWCLCAACFALDDAADGDGHYLVEALFATVDEDYVEADPTPPHGVAR